MNRCIICRVAIACCTLLILMMPGRTLAEDSAGRIGEELQSFGDKIVVISVEMSVGNERYSSAATLKDAKLIRLGDRTFIRGIGFVAKGDEKNEEIAWFNGIDASYAWDGVVDFYVFTPEQHEQYRKWVQQHDNENE